MLATLVLAILVGAELDQPLTEAQIEEDLRRVSRALDEAYAGKSFAAIEGWKSFQHRLLQLKKTPYRDRAAFCSALARMLAEYGEGSIYAALDDRGPRCTAGDHIKRSGDFYEAEKTGPNVAAAEPNLYLLRIEPGARLPPVAVLGIRRFDPPNAPGWKGFEAAAAAAVDAAALIVDLRGARGSDPTIILPMINRLSGEPNIYPLQGEIRTKHELPIHRISRDRQVWSKLIGPEPASYSKSRDISVDRAIFVLIGEGCEEACELAARMLEAYAGAILSGAAGTERAVSFDAPGLLLLPHSRVRVFMPTVAYRVNEYLGRVSGDRGAWYQRGRSYRYVRREGDLSAHFLAVALEGARHRLELKQRVARWRGKELRHCSSYLPIERQADLPPAAKEKLSGWFDPREVQFVTVHLDLPQDRAIEFLAGCPGFKHAPWGSQEHGTTRANVYPRSFAALSRVIQADVVRHVNIEEDREPKHHD